MSNYPVTSTKSTDREITHLINGSGPLDRPFRCTEWLNIGGRSQETHDITPRELARLVGSKHKPRKDQLPGLTFAVFGDKPSKKKCLRHGANFETATAVVIDIDDSDGGTFAENAERVRKAGVTAIGHTSPRYKKGVKEKQRWIFPLDKECDREEHFEIAGVAWSIFEGKADKSVTFDAVRYNYFGSCDEGDPVETCLIGGTYIDQVTDIEPTWPEGEKARSNNLSEKPDPRERYDYGAAFCRVYSPHDVLDQYGDAYEQDDADRYTFIGGDGVSGAIVYDQYFYSNHATDPLHGRCLDAFELAGSLLFEDFDYHRDYDTLVAKICKPDDDVIAEFKAAIKSIFDDLGPLPEDEKPKSKSTLCEVTLSELRKRPFSFDFVENTFFDDTVGILYGTWGTFKSFLACSVSLSVSADIPWCGCQVERRAVGYVVLEGGGRMRCRIDAWFFNHPDVKENLIPFTLFEGALNLREDKATRQYIADRMKALADRFGVKLGFVIIDTLSHAMAGGDENSSDLTALIEGACDIKRFMGGGTVLLVAHEGKDPSKGLRGHSSGGGNVDTMLRTVRKGEGVVLEIVKQKDGVDGIKMALAMKQVELPYTDARDKPLTSLVAIPAALGAFENLDEVDARTAAALEIRETLDNPADLAAWRAALKANGWPVPDVSDDAFRKAWARLDKA